MTIDTATTGGSAHVALEGNLVVIGFGAIGLAAQAHQINR